MLTKAFEPIDPRFLELVYGNVHVETLIEGCRFAEGPVYVPAGRYLLCSDIPNDRLMRWDETNGAVSIFRQPSGYANGNTLDRQGRLVTCEHQGRRVSRTEHDGTITDLASLYQGRRLNSPNDVIVDSNDTVWFTDPSYGIDSHYEGDVAPQEQSGRYVFRRSAAGELAIATDGLEQPNGLVLSPDEKLLYVVDSGRARNICRFDVGADGSLSGGSEFAKCPTGIFDGIEIDRFGNLWASAGDGVYCYGWDGVLLGRIEIPEVVSNLCFGGIKRNRLFVTAATSVYSVFLKTRGVPLAMK